MGMVETESEPAAPSENPVGDSLRDLEAFAAKL